MSSEKRHRAVTHWNDLKVGDVVLDSTKLYSTIIIQKDTSDPSVIRLLVQWKYINGGLFHKGWQKFQIDDRPTWYYPRRYIKNLPKDVL